jgi:hypothetical protein
MVLKTASHTIYRVSFFCHGCGLENSFTFSCWGDYYAAVQKATTFSCPSGCNPQKTVFELTQVSDIQWEEAVEAVNAVFH